MSDMSSLSQLSLFVGRSGFGAEGAPVRLRTINALTAAGRQHHGVTDLLALVMVLSARTRRAVLPKVTVDLDVFGPNGGRAVRLMLPRA
jgi:hypothetical protein